jgi:hypothetical protein
MSSTSEKLWPSWVIPLRLGFAYLLSKSPFFDEIRWLCQDVNEHAAHSEKSYQEKKSAELNSALGGTVDLFSSISSLTNHT